MEVLARKVEIIQAELQKQNIALNDRIGATSDEVEELEQTFSKVKEINEAKLPNCSAIEKQEIENDMRFNKYLYDLELRKIMCKKSYYKNEIQSRELYVIRCIVLMNYRIAVENHNAIEETQKFFALTNHVYQEFVKNYQFLNEFYREKKDIHENYVLLLSLFPGLDEKRKAQIEKNLLSDEEYQDLINKISSLDATLEDYKEMFKTKKIPKANINEKCFNYSIDTVVENIYHGVRSNEVSNTK